MGYPTEVVFVFGSNLAGRHGAGAALHAKIAWGAVVGVGSGPTGNAYALPTKDAQLRTRSLAEIKASYLEFCRYVEGRKELFLLTPIGTGLAGYPRGVIRGIIQEVGVPRNVMLTGTWIC